MSSRERLFLCGLSGITPVTPYSDQAEHSLTAQSSTFQRKQAMGLPKDLHKQTCFIERFRTHALGQQNIPEGYELYSSSPKMNPRSGSLAEPGRVSGKKKMRAVSIFSMSYSKYILLL